MTLKLSWEYLIVIKETSDKKEKSLLNKLATPTELSEKRNKNNTETKFSSDNWWDLEEVYKKMCHAEVSVFHEFR